MSRKLSAIAATVSSPTSMLPAVAKLIDHLGARGFDRQQAYALCSVAVDLRIS